MIFLSYHRRPYFSPIYRLFFTGSKLSILQTQIQRPRYTKPQIVDWISRFKYGNVNDPNYQRQIIDIFINSIYVFDDKLAFTYNFHDSTETITLKDIEAAFGSDLSQVAPLQSLFRRGDGFLICIHHGGECDCKILILPCHTTQGKVIKASL